MFWRKLPRRVLCAAVAAAALSCTTAPGLFDPFDVTVNVLGAGTGNGRVTETEALVNIDCRIVGGEPNSLGDLGSGDGPCRSTFAELNGLGTFILFAAADLGHEFVGWSGDCAPVGVAACRLSWASREALTLTVTAEFRPVGLIIAPPSVHFPPLTAP